MSLKKIMPTTHLVIDCDNHTSTNNVIIMYLEEMKCNDGEKTDEYCVTSASADGCLQTL
jgi:hypothetical protein